MRIYRNFGEAFGELRRELKEMGVQIANTRVQDKDVLDEDYRTLELTNYAYTVLEPKVDDLPLTDIQWFNHEWIDRVKGIEGNPVNPGLAWVFRDNIWSDFLERNFRPRHRDSTVTDGEITGFSYSYSERLAMGDQVRRAILALKRDHVTRQAFISIWDPHRDPERLLDRRVPCSLGYHLMYRDGGLNILYLMRSCELHDFFYYDIGYALLLQKYVADAVSLPPGKFAHLMGSFHVYAKNVADSF